MVQEGNVIGHFVSNKGTKVDKETMEVIEKLSITNLYEGCKEFPSTCWSLSTIYKEFFKKCKTSHLIASQECTFNFNEECLSSFLRLFEECLSSFLR